MLLSGVCFIYFYPGFPRWSGNADSNWHFNGIPWQRIHSRHFHVMMLKVIAFILFKFDGSINNKVINLKVQNWYHTDILVHECGNSSVLAMEILQCYPKLLIYFLNMPGHMNFLWISNKYFFYLSYRVLCLHISYLELFFLTKVLIWTSNTRVYSQSIIKMKSCG